MPELPEVEILVRKLAPLLQGKTIVDVNVRRPRLLRPTSPSEMKRVLAGATIQSVARRGKYLVFTMTDRGRGNQFTLLGHLGMTGRMFLQNGDEALPRHTVIALSFGGSSFVFEDMRGFGRWTLDTTSLSRLGPEPLGGAVAAKRFAGDLRRSRQAIKIKLLDQSVIAGVGNIYASEALFDAGIFPRTPSCRLSRVETARLWGSVRMVLRDAIRLGSRVQLDLSGRSKDNRLFYYGGVDGADRGLQERFKVYDRESQACTRCGSRIRRMVQAARSTYYCPRCQRV